MSASAGEEKKGLHPLAKVGIGCGVLVLLGVVAAVVAAVLGVNFFKGKVAEAEREQAEMQARWLAESGIVSGGLEELSTWFDLPDGVTGLRSIVHTEEDGTMSGQIAAESRLQPVALGRAFADRLEGAGFEQVKKSETEDEVMYIFDQSLRGRTVVVTITAGTGASTVEMNYAEE